MKTLKIFYSFITIGLAYQPIYVIDELKQWKMDFLKDKLEVDKARLSYDTTFTRALNETSDTHIQVLSLQLLSIESKFPNNSMASLK